MSNYTSQMEESLYNKWNEYDTADDDFNDIIEYLNADGFRSFGEGLQTVIMPKAVDGETAVACLKRCCKEKCIDITKELASVNTIKNWFSGGERPKKGEDSRHKMFVIAFALSLTADETAYIMQKVLLDRAFNPRNYKELIYYYCLENKRSLAQAEDMISKININASEEMDKTIYTSALESVAGQAQSDDELIGYINSHPHNFSVSNIAAKKSVEEYIAKAKACVAKEIDSPEYNEIKYGKNIESTNFMYEIIIGQSVTGAKGTKTIFKNADLPKEIKVSFPETTTFSKSEQTYDELRKILILLFSYCFWYKVQSSNNYADIDDYTAQLDMLLLKSGLPTVYPGNPFDWLFCYCTMTDRPLDTFRGVIAEVLDNE